MNQSAPMTLKEAMELATLRAELDAHKRNQHDMQTQINKLEEDLYFSGCDNARLLEALDQALKAKLEQALNQDRQGGCDNE